VSEPRASRHPLVSTILSLTLKPTLKLVKPIKFLTTKPQTPFKIQNAYTIGLRIKESRPSEEITYESTAGSPFPFTLKVQLKESGAQTTGQLICDAQINPFLEMMVKAPLKNLFDYMAGQLPGAMGV
jgi:hypothetical protein